MNKSVQDLKNLAEVVGWKVVAIDQGFTSYDYTINLSKNESVTYLLRIFDEQTEGEFYQTLFVIKSVLPRKLRKKVSKITKKILPENISGVIDVLKFAIEENKAKTTYAKLKMYGEALGVDIQNLGYYFEYEMTKRREKEILALIEASLPVELAPSIGRLKRIEYKMAYYKENKAKYVKEKTEEE